MRPTCSIQIEGSGRVILEDGTPLRVAFDSHNGYAFSSIERVLIDRKIIARKDISTQAIRDRMARIRTKPRRCAPPTAPTLSFASPGSPIKASRLARGGAVDARPLYRR